MTEILKKDRTICVTGGRSNYDRLFICPVLETVKLFSRSLEIGHGDCKTGVDRITKLWIEMTGRNLIYGTSVIEKPFPANWSLGKKAGPIRNRQMLDEMKPEFLIAFKGGRGTADCIKAAKERNIKVFDLSTNNYRELIKCLSSGIVTH